MGKQERLPPKKRAASGLHHAVTAASPPAPRSPTLASSGPSNPFVKREHTHDILSQTKPSGTRNKNSGFTGISKRKRVRLDKREKKRTMALAGKLKGVASNEVPAVPLETRAKADAAKERERKKLQKLKKKRVQRALTAASAPTVAKKQRRSRSQVAADLAIAAADSNAVCASSSSNVSEELNCIPASGKPGATESNSPSKKMLRKLQMKEQRAAAKSEKSALKSGESKAAPEIPKISSSQLILDQKTHTRPSEAADKSIIKDVGHKKQRANEFPYAVDASDHAETPAVAYADIVPVLSSIATALGKSHSDIVIFDPFYCQGSVRRNLAALGFTNVINEKQDFYSNPIPEYDVLLTNPPYSHPSRSGDHLDKIVEFAASSSKPWLLLLPNFVVGRSSYTAAVSKLHPLPFYVVPAVRYAYIVPSWVGARATAPFPSFWYAHCAGPLPPLLVAAAAASSKLNVRAWRATSDAQPLFIESIKALPQDVRDVTDPLKKRSNPRARKRMSSAGSFGSKIGKE